MEDERTATCPICGLIINSLECFTTYKWESKWKDGLWEDNLVASELYWRCPICQSSLYQGLDESTEVVNFLKGDGR